MNEDEEKSKTTHESHPLPKHMLARNPNEQKSQAPHPGVAEKIHSVLLKTSTPTTPLRRLHSADQNETIPPPPPSLLHTNPPHAFPPPTHGDPRISSRPLHTPAPRSSRTASFSPAPSSASRSAALVRSSAPSGGTGTVTAMTLAHSAPTTGHLLPGLSASNEHPLER